MFPRQELLQVANDLCLAIPDFEGFLDVLRQVRRVSARVCMYLCLCGLDWFEGEQPRRT